MPSIETIERALLQWLDSRCAPAPASRLPAEVQEFVQWSGARGIVRWGAGRRAMDVLHGVSALLELIQDADDDHTALKQGCSWAREHVNADAAGGTLSE